MSLVHVSPSESSASRAVAILLPVALVLYAIATLVLQHRWLSPAAAVLVAALLWRRYRRARFSAYIFFTAVGVRGLLTHVWPLAAFAAAAIAVLQLPAARRVWPSVPGPRGNGDRMAPP